MIVLNAILEERRKRDNARCLAYYRDNRERLQEANSQWKKDNPDKVRKHQRTQNNKYHHLSKEQRKEWSLKSNYGITYEQFDSMLKSQNGLCPICGIEMVVWEGQGKPDCACVDHCHSTGVIRGLLCGSCNRAIGLLKDDPAIIDKASQYLRSPPQPPQPPAGPADAASPAPEGGGEASVPPPEPIPPEMAP